MTSWYDLATLAAVSISDGQLLAAVAAAVPAVGAWLAWYRKRAAEAEDAVRQALERVVALTAQLGAANTRAAVLGEQVDASKRETQRLRARILELESDESAGEDG